LNDRGSIIELIILYLSKIGLKLAFLYFSKFVVVFSKVVFRVISSLLYFVLFTHLGSLVVVILLGIVAINIEENLWFIRVIMLKLAAGVFILDWAIVVGCIITIVMFSEEDRFKALLGLGCVLLIVCMLILFKQEWVFVFVLECLIVRGKWVSGVLVSCRGFLVKWDVIILFSLIIVVKYKIIVPIAALIMYYFSDSFKEKP